MKTKTLTLHGIEIEVFYDTHIRLWTACRVDNGETSYHVDRDYLLTELRDLLDTPKVEPYKNCMGGIIVG